MKNFSKLLFLLPLAFCCIKSNTSEAKVCFLVGLEEQCGRETFAEIKDCEKLGYSITEEICAAQGKTPGGAHCGDYWEKCVCNTSKYPYLETENHEPYILTGDRCENYRQYKVCPNEFKYSGTCHEKELGKCLTHNSNGYSPVSAVSYTEHTPCPYNSIPSGSSCTESYPVDMINFAIIGGNNKKFEATNEEKWTECSCNRETYPYLREDVDLTIFSLDEENFCIDTTDTTYYGPVDCAGDNIVLDESVKQYYAKTCDSAYEYSPENDISLGQTTCHKCTKIKTCSDICSGKGGVGYSAASCVTAIENDTVNYCQHQELEGCYCLIGGGQCPIDWHR